MNRWMFALVGTAFLTTVVLRMPSQAEGGKEKNQMLKAVIHVNFSDTDRQGHGLKNVENILKEMGSDVEIEVVAHGSGIGLLVQGQSKHEDKVRSLLDHKVRFMACKNTLHDKSIPQDQLLPGVQIVPSGSVEVLQKQQEGYSYFKP